MPDKPTDLSIDVDQWRRDIQTFAQTTQQALDAIVAELSNQCSGGLSPRPLLDSGHDSVASFDHAPFENKFPNPSVHAAINDHGDERLENLKAKLAAQISKSNPASYPAS